MSMLNGGGINWKDDETYIEAYARNIGPLDRYAKMTDKQLGRWNTFVRHEFGAALMILRREPDSITGKEILTLIEPHHEAIIKEYRGRMGITPAKIKKCRKALQKINAEATA